MPEPTLAELHRLLLVINRSVAEARQETARVGSRVEAVAAEVSGVKIVDAKLDEVARDLGTLSVKVDSHFEATSQVLAGVRSLGKSTFDIVTGTTRRVRRLVQALIERGVISANSMQDALLASEDEGGSADDAAAESGQPRR